MILTKFREYLINQASSPKNGWYKQYVLEGFLKFLMLNPHYNDVAMGSMASQITSLIIVYSAVYSGADQGKHQSSASLAFVRGIHRGPVNSPHKWPVTRQMFPFDDVIMICVKMGDSRNFHPKLLVTEHSSTWQNSFGSYFREWVVLGKHHPSTYMCMISNELISTSACSCSFTQFYIHLVKSEERVVKFCGLSRTADGEVHAIDISRVIITVHWKNHLPSHRWHVIYKLRVT